MVDIESYYIIKDYSFNYDVIGFVIIEPNEVALLPSVLIDTEIAENSCMIANNKEKPFLLQILNSDKKTLSAKYGIHWILVTDLRCGGS
jgi:hypothetical protein